MSIPVGKFMANKTYCRLNESTQTKMNETVRSHLDSLVNLHLKSEHIHIGYSATSVWWPKCAKWMYTQSCS